MYVDYIHPLRLLNKYISQEKSGKLNATIFTYTPPKHTFL